MYLRANMLQERLNHLMLLHVHKERTDRLDLVHVANNFAASPHRRDIFGTFTTSDLAGTSVLQATKATQTVKFETESEKA